MQAAAHPLGRQTPGPVVGITAILRMEHPPRTSREKGPNGLIPLNAGICFVGPCQAIEEGKRT
jgi:hypothetical protein